MKHDSIRWSRWSDNFASLVGVTMMMSPFTGMGFSFQHTKRNLESKVEKLKEEAEKNKKNEDLMPLADQCANFSGTWTGICYPESGSEDEAWVEEVTYKQEGCTSILSSSESPGEPFRIDFGKISNWKIEENEYNISLNMVANWNSSQTRLFMLSSYMMQFGVFSVPPFAVISTEEMWMEGDTLLTRSGPFSDTFDPFGRSQVSRVNSQFCIYERADGEGN